MLTRPSQKTAPAGRSCLENVYAATFERILAWRPGSRVIITSMGQTEPTPAVGKRRPRRFVGKLSKLRCQGKKKSKSGETVNRRAALPLSMVASREKGGLWRAIFGIRLTLVVVS